MKRALHLHLIAGFCGLLPAILLAQAPGSLDLAFAPDIAYSDILWALAVQPDGKILAAGRQGASYGVVYRLDGNGRLDVGSQSGMRATCADSAVPQINTLALQTNGNIILGGQFTLHRSIPVPGGILPLEKLNSNVLAGLKSVDAPLRIADVKPNQHRS